MGRSYREVNSTFLRGKDNVQSLEQSNRLASSLERGELAALGDCRPSLARGPGLIELEVKSFYNFLIRASTLWCGRVKSECPLFK